MKTFFPYEKNSCIDLIFALATNFTLKAMTVVELSLSRFFKRKYSSLYRAIGGYFASRKNKKNREEKRAEAKEKIKSFLFKSAIEDTGNTHIFAIEYYWQYKKALS